MEIKTHAKVSSTLVGIPIDIEDGVKASVKLSTTVDMVTDSSGLIHGGFIFGLADYTAMLAINQPNVVLGSAQVRFTTPVKIGETMTAEANILKTEGIKSEVNVDVKVRDKKVFNGTFVCYALEKHVLLK
jgi:acyl-coenzyme A thioesterase PaaI-like protein